VNRAGDVHHDLVHILATAGGLVSALRRLPTEPLGTRLLELLDHELSDGAALLASLKERPVPGGRTDLCELLDHVVGAVAGGTDTNVRLECESGSAASAARLTVRQIVRNMLDNAVRAAGPGGTVLVRAYTEGPDAVVEVHDSGPGFAATPPVAPGLAGRGVFLVERAAREAGGCLWTGRSRSLRGAAVGVSFPKAAPAGAPLDRSGQRQDRRGQRGRVS
jgi:Histidine kinase-, DNA gyrase B-, and HSP90-like ATPase